MRRLSQVAIVAAAVLEAGLGAGSARADDLHIYSYDPADADTRLAAGPLTFTVKKGLLHTTVLNLRSTEAPATAYLRPADERALGQGGLAAAVGAQPAERELDQVEPAKEGAALIAASVRAPGAPGWRSGR